MIRRLLRFAFVRFAMVGGGCTALDFVLFYLFYEQSALPLVLSNLLSYGTGLTVSFFLNRRYTFGPISTRRVWLCLGFGYAGLLLNTLIVWALAALWSVWAGKVIAVAVVLVYNYLANKYVVFAK